MNLSRAHIWHLHMAQGSCKFQLHGPKHTSNTFQSFNPYHSDIFWLLNACPQKIAFNSKTSFKSWTTTQMSCFSTTNRPFGSLLTFSTPRWCKLAPSVKGLDATVPEPLKPEFTTAMASFTATKLTSITNHQIYRLTQPNHLCITNEWSFLVLSGPRPGDNSTTSGHPHRSKSNFVCPEERPVIEWPHLTVNKKLTPR